MTTEKTDLILTAIAGAKTHMKALLIELVNVDASSMVVSDISSAIEYLDNAAEDAKQKDNQGINEVLLPVEVKSFLSESQTLEIVQTVRQEIDESLHGVIQAMNRIVDEKYANHDKQQVKSGVPDAEFLKGFE